LKFPSGRGRSDGAAIRKPVGMILISIGGGHHPAGGSTLRTPAFHRRVRVAYYGQHYLRGLNPMVVAKPIQESTANQTS